ncbi:MAG: TonB-dependent receptor [Sphingomonas sp.]|jgi:hypothetical protein|uniref:TonB-dependent receptor n=1 Tax=Sphingomonas sp. TaxID=28214 RepID=UPI003566FDA9
MNILAKALVSLTLVAGAAPAVAQEIVVTGSLLRSRGLVDVAPSMPSVTMRRMADFAVQRVTLTGDTREAARRRDEIYAMVRGAIDLQGKYGVELSTGTLVVEPLTIANYRDLPLEKDDDDRADTETTTFLVKTRLAPGMDAKAALDRITKFIAAVPSVGRAELKADGDMTLSVVKPEQYRGAIVDLIAADSAANAAKFGAGYGVEVRGLDRPVEWARASLTEVFLYLPMSYTVRPK